MESPKIDTNPQVEELSSIQYRPAGAVDSHASEPIAAPLEDCTENSPEIGLAEFGDGCKYTNAPPRESVGSQDGRAFGFGCKENTRE